MLYLNRIMLLTGLLISTAGCHQKPLPYQEPIEPLLEAELGNDIEQDNRHTPGDLRKVAQYQHDTLMNILEFDRRGRLLFKYYKQYVGEFWNGRYVTMLTANVYDGDRLIKVYELHSNVGLSVRHYVDSWLGTERTIFYQDNEYESNLLPANSNPFRFVEGLTSYQAVLKHPKVLELEKRAPRQLIERVKGDRLGRIIERTYFSEQGKAIRTIVYAYEGRRLTGEREYVDDYSNSTNTRCIYSSANQLQELLTTDSRGDTLAYQQGRYSARGELKERLDFEQKQNLAEFGLGSYSRYGKVVYYYEKPQSVSRMDYYTVAKYGNCQTDCALKLQTTTCYRRNKEGFVTERREINHLTSKEKAYRYRYSYWYF